MQRSFLRRYLTYILIAASNWHDKRVTASGWHFSHPSCHWKHNAFATCLFFRHKCAEPVLGTRKQSSCMLFTFVCGASSVAQELGSGSNSDELVFFIRVWHEVDGNSGVLVEHPQVWEDESKASSTASLTSSVGEGLVLLLTLYALHRTRQNLVVLSAQGKKSDFKKMSYVVHVNWLPCMYAVLHLICKKAKALTQLT